MAAAGYTIQTEEVQDPSVISRKHHVPDALASCHTAIVDGYIIQGHVPIDAVDRLLAERPDIAGLAVPGMPIGSPGMEIPGVEAEPFDVIAFDAQGNQSVFASYP